MSNLVQSMLEGSVKILNEQSSVDNAVARSQGVADAVAALDVERVSRAFLNMRAARENLAAEFKKADDAIKAKQKILENAMLRFLNQTGQKRAAVEGGVIYKQEEITPTGADWEAFYAWIKEHDAFDFLERRIKRKEVKDYMDEHDGAAPPGVNVFREYKVVFRRS